MTKIAVETVTNNTLVLDGQSERIAQTLVKIRGSQAIKLSTKHLKLCLARIANLYDMDENDAKSFLKNVSEEHPEDLKIIYAEIVKDAQKEFKTTWTIASTIASIISVTSITLSVIYSSFFLLILCMLLVPILTVAIKLYDTNSCAGSFLSNTKRIKQIAGENYCPLELIREM